MKQSIVDTGPIVALLDRMDRDHKWAVDQSRRLPPRMITCEAVLSEAHFLTREVPGARDRIESWLSDGWLAVSFDAQDHHSAVHDLMGRYSKVPMSFADACLVRMSELHPETPIFTLDSDFRVYRRNRRQAIPLICP